MLYIWASQDFLTGLCVIEVAVVFFSPPGYAHTIPPTLSQELGESNDNIITFHTYVNSRFFFDFFFFYCRCVLSNAV